MLAGEVDRQSESDPQVRQGDDRNEDCHLVRLLHEVRRSRQQYSAKHLRSAGLPSKSTLPPNATLEWERTTF